jgi:hypothetical protein
VVFLEPGAPGKKIACAGCGQQIVVPPYAADDREQPVGLACPVCGHELPVTRKLHGRKASCACCGTALSISTEPWSLAVLDNRSPGPAAVPSAHSPPAIPTAPDLIRYRCPHCSAFLQSSRQCIGKTVHCACGHQLQVPGDEFDATAGERSSPPTVLGLLSLVGVITAVALVSALLGTLLWRPG